MYCLISFSSFFFARATQDENEKEIAKECNIWSENHRPLAFVCLLKLLYIYIRTWWYGITSRSCTTIYLISSYVIRIGMTTTTTTMTMRRIMMMMMTTALNFFFFFPKNFNFSSFCFREKKYCNDKDIKYLRNVVL